MLYTGRVETKSGVLNVRSTPGGPVIGMLVKGDKVEVLADEGAWVHVTCGLVEGYVSKQYVIFHRAPSDARMIVTDEAGNSFVAEGETSIRIATGAID